MSGGVMARLRLLELTGRDVAADKLEGAAARRPALQQVEMCLVLDESNQWGLTIGGC
jgi:hypothetical protein